MSSRGPSSTSFSARASRKRSEPRHTLVFAFGSNLDLQQMQRRCGVVDVVGVALLPGHRLAFGGYSRTWGGAVATVVPARGGLVPGVLYRLDREALGLLDAHEGAPHAYRREQVRVFAATRRWRKADAYLLNGADGGRPSRAYLDTIGRAYRAWGFTAKIFTRPLERAAKAATRLS